MNTASQLKQKEIETINQETKSCLIFKCIFDNYVHLVRNNE